MCFVFPGLSCVYWLVDLMVVEFVDVTWNHHMVFPVFFNGHEIEKWWNSMLVMKIHYREPSSKTVSCVV